MAPQSVFTIGHSTHSIDEFLTLLRANDVDLVADVRTIAGSRHNPQFGEHELEKWLPAAGIGYERITALGGLRHSKADTPSVNSAWRNASFRSFADYMQSPEFSSAIDELMAVAAKRKVAIMCAEAVPWRCHRSLIGDALLARGVSVFDIMSATSTTAHRMTPFARVEGSRVWYPADSPE